MESKRCYKCGVVKPLDDYQRHKSKADGRQSYCRECTNEANRVWREANRERAKEASRAWREANKERVREVNRAWYENNRERSLGNNRAWYQANKERAREYSRVWREENRERHLANGRAWAEANRERARETSRAWQRANPDKRATIVHRRRARKSSAVPQRWTVDHTLGDPLACWWCGRGLLGATAHVDHVMPIRLGGPADTANEVMSCADCNHSKNAKHPLVWIAELVS